MKQQALPFLDICCSKSYELTSNPFAPVTAWEPHPFRNLVPFFPRAVTQCLVFCVFLNFTGIHQFPFNIIQLSYPQVDPSDEGWSVRMALTRLKGEQLDGWFLALQCWRFVGGICKDSGGCLIISSWEEMSPVLVLSVSSFLNKIGLEFMLLYCMTAVLWSEVTAQLWDFRRFYASTVWLPR